MKYFGQLEFHGLPAVALNENDSVLQCVAAAPSPGETPFGLPSTGEEGIAGTSPAKFKENFGFFW